MAKITDKIEVLIQPVIEDMSYETSKNRHIHITIILFNG
jgi:hypothetical protein